MIPIPAIINHNNNKKIKLADPTVTSSGGARRRDLSRPGPAEGERPSVREDVPLHPADAAAVQVRAEASSAAGESGDQALVAVER